MKPLQDPLPLTDNTNILRNIDYWCAKRHNPKNSDKDRAIREHIGVLIMVLQTFIK